MLKKVILFIILSIHFFYAKTQECYTIQRDVKSNYEWSMLLDTIFRDAVINDSDDASALLILKISSSGVVLSAHIRSSNNLDSTVFYKVCSRIEDCYSYSFLAEMYRKLEDEYKRLISKEYMYTQYVYRFHPN